MKYCNDCLGRGYINNTLFTGGNQIDQVTKCKCGSNPEGYSNYIKARHGGRHKETQQEKINRLLGR